MSLRSLSKTLFLILSIAFVSQVAYDYYRRKKCKQRKEIHEVIMFSHGVTVLKKSKYSRCMITTSMDRLLYYLNTPRYTLDLCIYVFTSLDLGNAIQKLVYRGVKIRVIVDAEMAFSSGSFIRKLEKLRVPVRWMKSTNIMHHKFCLVDALSDDERVTPLVITGSLNWTTQALNGNWENVVVTSQRELVEKYRTEFEKLWTMFKPLVDVTY